MRSSVFVVLFLACLCVVPALAEPTVAPEIKTTRGEVYKRAYIKRIEGDKAVIFHMGGAARVLLDELPDDARMALGMPTRQQEVDADREHAAKGLVKYENEWVTPEVKAQREGDKKAMEFIARQSDKNALYRVVKADIDGSLCQRGRRDRRNGSFIFDGEMFYLYGASKEVAADGGEYYGDLFWAGTYDLRGEDAKRSTINSYSHSVDIARDIVKVKLGLDHRIALLPPKEPGPANAAADPSVKGYGSGFGVTPEGHVLTNYHVIAKANGVFVKTEQEYMSARVVSVDETNDLALLKVEKPLIPVSFAPDRNARLGQTVFTVGFPMPSLQGFSPKVTKGVISALKGLQDDSRLYQIDAAVQPGNSGGPLSDESGNVVGVIVSRLSDNAVMATQGIVPQNVNYTIKLSYIQAFLDSCPGTKGKMTIGSSEQKVSFEEAVDRVSKSTVLVVVK